VPRAIPAILMAMLLTAGCGTSSRESAALRHWPAQAPYFPPPDPAAYAGVKPADPGAGARPIVKQPRADDTGVPTDAQVEQQLREALGADSTASARDLIERATLSPDGLATVPPGAPARVAAIIRGGNEVARKPYVYGGGHGRLAGETWIDTAYDCSGSISFALATAGLADQPMTSGTLAAWGRPGPGRWVTIYANGGHAFMTVAGLRFDTSGRQITGTRWQTAGRSVAGFSVRHPPGL
jgi:hypothetical protein